ncbi:MAG TPA: IS982 family transposase [Balneolaceae bacterium]|nr:IS982 family transposase [Balneolaceae bacterium]
MHDLKDNFDKILPIVKLTLADQLNSNNNLQFYPNKPKLTDACIISFALLQEALGIDSERWFWSKLKTDYNQAFNLPDLSRYNRRRKRLAHWTHQLARLWSKALSPGEDTFIVDSIPVPVAHIAREHATKVCRENFDTAPDKGYSAVLSQFYIGYKLHLLVSLNGVYQRMELTKASVHDSQYLKNIKTSGIKDSLLLADRGYLSEYHQIDLFYNCGIELQTPMRSNQKGFRRWPKTFKNARKRIEVVFAQLCDQMMLKRNYAKPSIVCVLESYVK